MLSKRSTTSSDLGSTRSEPLPMDGSRAPIPAAAIMVPRITPCQSGTRLVPSADLEDTLVSKVDGLSPLPRVCQV